MPIVQVDMPIRGIGKTYRSPRRSTTYPSTPPGILTSTRMSTLLNALKQQYVPPPTCHSDPLVANHAWGSSMWNWSELMYAAREAEDDASTPER